MNIPAFQFPYTARIMGRLNNDEPIELYRPPRRGQRIDQSAIRNVTNDLSPGWDWWLEHWTAPHYLVGPRPIPSHLHKERDPTSNGKGGLRLTFSEIHQINGGGPRLTEWQ